MSDAAIPRPARADSAAYMRWYRATFRAKARRDIAVQRARHHALVRLAELYPAEMRELYSEEIQRLD